ncbi:MAG TPA: biopolymer transporter ExbD [Candidatus Marinimicrobia bacterium]|nr:biopolymer transporter ExbD [Candidatus Neomarinimicrobiota bacterium]HPI27242.1 biopolymer transporter ExbD [Candidatus Neomarinimicrobiota bacterium]HPN74272.1 biopolymer transporter ExbD [Candidatus Neomarinimicrobiota bacterium]HQE94251.1 biopolymer transporter ExbD [Candidatus Neomarinimicrobiota bacterium]HQH55050.1 biopolymer transporter ExbD [Candidatus Neomarinimicrobiota bacterium]
MVDRRYKPLTEINITNLVDVTLTVLIIFMITTPLMYSGIEVDLPATRREITTVQEGILVNYSLDGQIFIDGQPVMENEFEKTLVKRWVQVGKKPVLLSADRKIEYGKIIKLIDRIKACGVTELGLIVETEQDKK